MRSTSSMLSTWWILLSASFPVLRPSSTCISTCENSRSCTSRSKLSSAPSARPSSCSCSRFFRSSSFARLQQSTQQCNNRQKWKEKHSLFSAGDEQFAREQPIALQTLFHATLVLLHFVPLLLQLLQQSPLHLTMPQRRAQQSTYKHGAVLLGDAALQPPTLAENHSHCVVSTALFMFPNRRPRPLSSDSASAPNPPNF
jgi:hypothetical protein